MVKYETLKSEKVEYGNRNFIEIARKRAIPDDGEEGEENEFISISRGYYKPDGNEIFKKTFSIPDDPKIKTFLSDFIREL